MFHLCVCVRVCVCLCVCVCVCVKPKVHTNRSFVLPQKTLFLHCPISSPRVDSMMLGRHTITPHKVFA